MVGWSSYFLTSLPSQTSQTLFAPNKLIGDRAKVESSFAQATMKYFWQKRHRLQTEPQWPRPNSPHSGSSSQNLDSWVQGTKEEVVNLADRVEWSGERWGKGRSLSVSSHFMTNHHSRLHITPRPIWIRSEPHCAKPRVIFLPACKSRLTHRIPLYFYFPRGWLT